ncbi:hypothetical protein BD289DRAFT_52595 [Coniella lustricola]|uniref:Extracellular membrane protein CFEM domain-containing protein n=1 Tax=Coniella lustricola TaxID=2025994 RepID=A0A2T3A137_9PEZI|nr:hypothetical protein BD289DRAFT_52595 [Coniella lustricola]
MQLTTLVALAMPAIAAAQSANITTTATTTTTTATASASAAPTPLDYETICESQAYGYADKCPQCLPQCEGQTTQTGAEECYYSVFFEINYIESLCEAQGGGSGCETIAVNDVCS